MTCLQHAQADKNGQLQPSMRCKLWDPISDRYIRLVLLILAASTQTLFGVISPMISVQHLYAESCLISAARPIH